MPAVIIGTTTTDGLVSRSIDVNGARLHYEVRGSGPLLLLISPSRSGRENVRAATVSAPKSLYAELTAQ